MGDNDENLKLCKYGAIVNDKKYNNNNEKNYYNNNTKNSNINGEIIIVMVMMKIMTTTTIIITIILTIITAHLLMGISPEKHRVDVALQKITQSSRSHKIKST